MKNLSVMVEDDFHKKVKTMASSKGITLRELLDEALKDYLKKESEGENAKTKN